MPTFSDFIDNFGWAELILTLLVIFTITGFREWKNVVKIFKNEK